MKRHPLILCSLMILLAGCSLPFLEEEGQPLPTARPVVVTAQPKPRATITLNPKVTTTPVPATEAAAPTDLSPVSPTAEGVASATSVPSPLEGWQTFTSPTLQVAVDYPADWSVVEQSGVVRFTSPQGGQMVLALMETGNLTPEDFLQANDLPNTRCEERTNAYGLTARLCFDTLVKVYSASIPMELPSGARQLVSLATFKLGDRRAFDLMFESVRIAP
jgi:hypothetical protein